MTVVDALATRSHYLEHLAPVWAALPVESRGRLWTPPHLAALVAALGLKSGGRQARGDTLLTAAWDDAATGGRWSTVALMEHGVGQSYGKPPHAAYAGGPGRCGTVNVFLCPNDRVAVANRAACPEARVEVVGVPWLDVLAGIVRTPDVDVGWSWHWDCDLCPETQSTFRFWEPAVIDVAGSHSMLGHSHPRDRDVAFARYRRAGIPTEKSFAAVVTRCRVFAADNTSTLFLAAALGLGVVVLNAPGYRRHVHHGLRFWDMADVGVQCDRHEDLAGAVDAAGPTARSAEIVNELFPWRGQAVARAVAVLVD